MGKSNQKKKKEKKAEKNRLNAEIRKRLNEQNREQEPEQLAPQEIQSSDEGTTTDTDGELSPVSRSDKGRDADTLQERRSAIPKNSDESVSSVQTDCADMDKHIPKFSKSKTSTASGSLLEPKEHSNSLSGMHPSKNEHDENGSFLKNKILPEKKVSKQCTAKEKPRSLKEPPSEIPKNPDESASSVQILSPDTVGYKHRLKDNKTSIAPASLFDPKGHCKSLSEMHPSKKEHQSLFDSNASIQSECESTVTGFAEDESNTSDLSKSHNETKEIYERHTSAGNSLDCPTNALEISDSPGPLNFQADYFSNNQRDISECTANHGNIAKSSNSKENAPECSIRQSCHSEILDREANPSDTSDSEIDETEWDTLPDVKQLPEDDDDSFEML